MKKLLMMSCIVLVTTLKAAVLTSPNGTFIVEFELQDGTPKWRVLQNKTKITNWSKLGVKLENRSIEKLIEIGSEVTVENSSWKPVWGKQSEIQNHYNGLTWKLKDSASNQIDVVARAYNDGIAVRYQLHGQGKISLLQDFTTLNFTDDFICWSANGERANHGPVKLSQYRGRQMPLTVKVNDKCYVSLLEGAITESAALSIKKAGKYEVGFQTGKSSLALPTKTSWRALIIGNRPGALLESTLLVNLNPASKIADTSWIKPGLALWDWRAWGGTGSDGFKYNLDMASW